MLGNMLFADGNFELVVVAMVADFRGESGKQGELGLKKTFDAARENMRFAFGKSSFSAP